MIAELGHFALALALGVAIVQAVLPMVGAARRDRGLMAIAPVAAVAQFLCLAIAFGSLMHAYVTSDFSVLNVVRNSHSLQPMLYKVSGMWGNHEGSLLLWVTVLGFFGSLVAVFGRNLPPALKARTLSVQAVISVGFLLFMLGTSNPFERVFPPPADGNNLNPLLQDPGLAFHPPMLYLGYVGLSVAFSFAVAALIEGKVDAAWARWVRPWTLLAWMCLTAGIGLGSWWAYYELGWGGFWFWDPVENASFMPWLAATALLHSAIVVEKRDALKSWTILLSIVGFSLSLIGTFLVRSGVLTSVHAFANDPERGVFILVLLAIAVGGSFALYAWRAPQLKGGGLFRPVSREGALVLNNLLLTAAIVTVLIGTLYPLFIDIGGGDKISVGAPYFNKTFIPIMLPLFIALGFGPLLAWKRGNLRAASRSLVIAFIVTLAVAAVSAVVLYGKAGYAAIGLAAAAWLIGSSLTELAKRAGIIGKGSGKSAQGVFGRLKGLPRSAWGMTLAHIGVAFVVAGATGATLLMSEHILVMKPGDSTTVGFYSVSFEGVKEVKGPNYVALEGDFAVARSGTSIGVLHPQKRRYLVGGRETTEAAIRSSGVGDVYVVIGDKGKEGGYAVRLYSKPLVPWLWTGVLLMVAGGGLSLSDRRLRVGAPKRAHAGEGGARSAPAAPAE